MISTNDSESECESNPRYESTTEQESDKSSVNYGFRTSRHCRKHRCCEHRMKRSKVERVNKIIKTRSVCRHQYCSSHLPSQSNSSIRIKKRKGSSKTKGKSFSSNESIIDLISSSDETNADCECMKNESAVHTNHTKSRKDLKKSKTRNKMFSSSESSIDLVSSSDETKTACASRKNEFAVHRKSVKNKNDFEKSKKIETKSESCPQLRLTSNYRHPLPGVTRMKTEDVSLIQMVAEQLKYPCVGLDKVTEIQGLHKVFYYCELCDVQCSFRCIIAHLESFHHRLNCLKPAAPLIYEEFSQKRQCEIENKVNKAIKTLVEIYGHGKIKVEKECLNDDAPCSSREREKHRKTGDCRNRCTSSDSSSSIELLCNSESNSDKGLSYSPTRRHSFRQLKLHATANCDFSYNTHNLQVYQREESPTDMYFSSMFHCSVCHIYIEHRNNWEMHLTGQKHIANTRKARGETPSKRQAVLLPNARASIMDRLDIVDEPIVGLDLINETQDSDAPGPMYTCLLCLHNTTSVNILSHILSLKHRIKFLEKIRHPSLQDLYNLSESELRSILRNICADIEAKQGRGYLNVFLRV